MHIATNFRCIHYIVGTISSSSFEFPANRVRTNLQVSQNSCYMKYIVTGGCGFIGSHLAQSLILSGHQVVVIDDLTTGRTENIEDLISEPGFTFLEQDVLSIQHWDSLLEEGDWIIHLAATVGVNKVVTDPRQTLDNNYQPTVRLLELCRDHGCKLLFASTSEVYGELSTEASTEKDPLVVPPSLCGRSAYILGKIMSEQYCMTYARQYSVPVIIARFFNVTGNHQLDRFGMVVPTFIRQALHHEPITLFGNGDQTRSFCNVADVVAGLRGLMENEAAYGEVFNIGGNERITIRELGNFIKETLNSRSPVIHIPFPAHRKEGRDILHRSASIQKIKALTGWEPVIPWKKTIESMIAHHLVFSRPLNLKS